MARRKPRHIIGWSYQDWRTSRIRARSIARKDPWLRVVYREILDALPEWDGKLPADSFILEDILGVPEEEIARCLPILERFGREPGSRGGVVIEHGLLTNARVTEELDGKAAVSEAQREGGKASAAAREAKYGTANPRAVVKTTSDKREVGGKSTSDPSPASPPEDASPVVDALGKSTSHDGEVSGAGLPNEGEVASPRREPPSPSLPFPSESPPIGPPVGGAGQNGAGGSPPLAADYGRPGESTIHQFARRAAELLDAGDRGPELQGLMVVLRRPWPPAAGDRAYLEGLLQRT